MKITFEGNPKELVELLEKIVIDDTNEDVEATGAIGYISDHLE